MIITAEMKIIDINTNEEIIDDNIAKMISKVYRRVTKVLNKTGIKKYNSIYRKAFNGDKSVFTDDKYNYIKNYCEMVESFLTATSWEEAIDYDNKRIIIINRYVVEYYPKLLYTFYVSVLPL